MRASSPASRRVATWRSSPRIERSFLSTSARAAVRSSASSICSSASATASSPTPLRRSSCLSAMRRQPPAAMAALDPLPGIGGVVDQADLGEPVEQLAGQVVRYAPLGELVGELLARARLPGQGVEQDLASHGLRIGLHLRRRGLLAGDAGRLRSCHVRALAPALRAGRGERPSRRGCSAGVARLPHPRLHAEADVTGPSAAAGSRPWSSGFDTHHRPRKLGRSPARRPRPRRRLVLGVSCGIRSH